MSFYYAFEGIIGAVRRETHLRFHIMIAVLIMIFAYFFGITKTEWAILLVDIGMVISAELINTAIEKTVDTATKDILPTAKLAKDAGAGAVLVLAIVSIFVGICLFGNLEKIKNTLILIFTTPTILIPCLITGALLLAFVIFGGRNVKEL